MSGAFVSTVSVMMFSVVQYFVSELKLDYIMCLRRISSRAKTPKISIDHFSQRDISILSPKAPMKISICRPCMKNKNAVMI